MSKLLLTLGLVSVVLAGCSSSPDAGDADKPMPKGATAPNAPAGAGGGPASPTTTPTSQEAKP